MHNEIISIGSFTIYGYGLMIAIGFIVALYLSIQNSKIRNLNKNYVIDIGLYAIISGIIGAKLLYCIVNIKALIQNPLQIRANGGFVVYGGIIFGLLTCYIYSKYKKFKFLEYSDLILPNVFIAQGFGRIGCFLAGCCYGKEYNSIISIVFTNSQFAPNNVSLLPTQLISSIFNFTVGIILIIIYKTQKTRDGTITSLYFITYGIGRFLIEFLRGDIERGTIGILTTSQFISLFIIVIGICINTTRNHICLPKK
jgi:phosphatidylglycerol:prolipoprotein diacylglycerol transferase